MVRTDRHLSRAQKLSLPAPNEWPSKDRYASVALNISTPVRLFRAGRAKLSSIILHRFAPSLRVAIWTSRSSQVLNFCAIQFTGLLMASPSLRTAQFTVWLSLIAANSLG